MLYVIIYFVCFLWKNKFLHIYLLIKKNKFNYIFYFHFYDIINSNWGLSPIPKILKIKL